MLDHLYSTIGQAKVTGASNGKTTYTTVVNYTSSFQGGTQEGVVIVYRYSQADGSIAMAAMVKECLVYSWSFSLGKSPFITIGGLPVWLIPRRISLLVWQSGKDAHAEKRIQRDFGRLDFDDDTCFLLPL